jgi:hypothetical protein
MSAERHPTIGRRCPLLTPPTYPNWRPQLPEVAFPYQPRTFSALFTTWLVSFLLFPPSVLLVVVFAGAGGSVGGRGGMLIGMLVGLAACLACGVTAIVSFVVFLYKGWNQVQDGKASQSPGLAVGLLFVPLFNVVWLFFAFWGLAKDANAYLDRYGIDGPQANAGLALTACILNACAIVPSIGVLVWLVGLILFMVAMHSIRTASMTIARAHLAAQQDQPGVPAF